MEDSLFTLGIPNCPLELLPTIVKYETTEGLAAETILSIQNLTKITKVVHTECVQ